MAAPPSLNPLNAELNPIRHLLALAGGHHFVHVSRVNVNLLGDIGLLSSLVSWPWFLTYPLHGWAAIAQSV